MDYKTIKIAKAFFSEKEEQGREHLELGMMFLGAFNASIPFAWLFWYSRTLRHRSSRIAGLKGPKEDGDCAP